MGDKLTLAAWNSIIDSVNDVLSTPPEDTDCEAVSGLPHVEAPHRWSKDDIRAIYSALAATCPDITTPEIPDKWKQSILDDINAALGQAWCQCEDKDDCDNGDADTVIRIYDCPAMEGNVGGFASSNCASPYGLGERCPTSQDIPTMSPAALLNGMQIGQGCVNGQSWVLIGRRYIAALGGWDALAGDAGVLDCNGCIQNASEAEILWAARPATEQDCRCTTWGGVTYYPVGPWCSEAYYEIVLQNGGLSCCDCNEYPGCAHCKEEDQ